MTCAKDSSRPRESGPSEDKLVFGGAKLGVGHLHNISIERASAAQPRIAVQATNGGSVALRKEEDKFKRRNRRTTPSSVGSPSGSSDKDKGKTTPVTTHPMLHNHYNNNKMTHLNGVSGAITAKPKANGHHHHHAHAHAHSHQHDHNSCLLQNFFLELDNMIAGVRTFFLLGVEVLCSCFSFFIPNRSVPKIPKDNWRPQHNSGNSSR